MNTKKALLSASLLSVTLGAGGCAMMCGPCSPRARSSEINPSAEKNPCAAHNHNPCGSHSPGAAQNPCEPQNPRAVKRSQTSGY